VEDRGARRARRARIRAAGLSFENNQGAKRKASRLFHLAVPDAGRGTVRLPDRTGLRPNDPGSLTGDPGCLKKGAGIPANDPGRTAAPASRLSNDRGSLPDDPGILAKYPPEIEEYPGRLANDLGILPNDLPDLAKYQPFMLTLAVFRQFCRLTGIIRDLVGMARCAVPVADRNVTQIRLDTRAGRE
jgi:hypothetical protein